MRLPKTRGHFWVVRDGEIVDADFRELRRYRKVHDCVPEVNIYLSAPTHVEKAMIRLYTRITLKAFNADNWDDMMEEFLFVAKMTGNADEPIFGKCWTNCIQEVYHNGGEIRFGSMGFKQKCDGETVWYYGNESCKDMSDYLF